MYVTIAQITAAGVLCLVFGFDRRYLVHGYFTNCRMNIEVIKLRGVSGEYTVFHRAVCRTERSETMFLLQVRRQLQASHRFNLPLW